MRIPLGLSLKNEDLSQDIKDTVLIAVHEGEAIACVMLHPLENNELKLRQMAVSQTWQGKGIGRQLVSACEQYAQEQGMKKIILHARYHARPFYEKLGYNIVGDMFTEVGIPHMKMEKSF